MLLLAQPPLLDQGGECAFSMIPLLCEEGNFLQFANRNATSASETGRPIPTAVPPEAAITMYCLPSLPMYVSGVEWPLAGSSVTHNSAPDFASKARNLWSFVAPIKTNPLAVAMLP